MTKQQKLTVRHNSSYSTPYYVLIETNKIDAYITHMEAIKSAMRSAVALGGESHYSVLEVHDEMMVDSEVQGDLDG
jgi:hypothetical protein